MPLFRIAFGKLTPVSQANFAIEKKLQSLVEGNLSPLFSCRLVASEYSTGALHAGRIDTLALSEDGNPVIIEYKKAESSDLINQSLFYLAWLSDHRGDFELAVQKALGKDSEVDWSAIRVLCIAPNYKRYDLHAVQMMGANIELWTYRLFANDTVYFEEVYQRSVGTPIAGGSGSATGSALTPGKKAALTRATGSYTFDQHMEGKPQGVRDICHGGARFHGGIGSLHSSRAEEVLCGLQDRTEYRLHGDAEEAGCAVSQAGSTVT